MEIHCRLCAKIWPKLQLCDILDGNAEPSNLKTKILKCFQVNISDDDKLPKFACLYCCKKLEKSFEFSIQVEAAQRTLRAAYLNVDLAGSRTRTNHSESDDHNVDDFLHCLLLEPNNDVSSDSLRNKCLETNQADTRQPVSQKCIKPPKTSQNVAKELRCSLCETTFESHSETQNHCNAIHRTPAGFVCTKCSDIYQDIGLFLKHTKNHPIKDTPTSTEGAYKCNVCGKHFSTKPNLAVHKNIHAGVRRFGCAECGKSFNQKAHLDNHLATHNDATPFHCQQCDKAFKTQNSLHIHSRKHLPKEIKYRHECDICHKRFTTTPSLKCHKKIHAGIQEYTCEQCGKSFMQKANLDEHSLTHTDATPFHCEKCPRAFKSIYRLRKHQVIHSEGKPHECESCGKKFREKRTLTRHRKIHTDDLPFVCEYCKKCFRMKAFLKVHIRQHTGERPYSCLECNHHFTNSSNYIKHMKGRHRSTRQSQP